MLNFSAIRASIDQVESKVREFGAEQQQIASTINRLTSAPAARSDMRLVVQDWIKRSGAAFAPAVKERLAKRHGTGQLPQHDIGFFQAIQSSAGTIQAAEMDAVLCALFPVEVEKCLCRIVDEMEWPDEGPPQAERESEIQRLQARALTISNEKAELLKNARTAGLDV